MATSNVSIKGCKETRSTHFIPARNRYTFSLSFVVFKLIKTKLKIGTKTVALCLHLMLSEQVKCLKPILCQLPCMEIFRWPKESVTRKANLNCWIIEEEEKDEEDFGTQNAGKKLYQGCPTRGPAGCVTRLPATLVKYIKNSPVTGPRCPEGSGKLRFPDYVTTAQDGGKVVSFTHLPPLLPGNAPGTHFC